MPLLATEAIVLHAFDYLESSRIIRLLTREAGVQSALARGARKSRGRYGTALDLFAEGSAQLYVKPNRELHNLASFEISRTRGELAEDIGRFTAASTIAELALRFAGEADNPQLYDTIADVLDRIARSAPERHNRGWPRGVLARRLRSWIHAGALQLRALSHSAPRFR